MLEAVQSLAAQQGLSAEQTEDLLDAHKKHFTTLWEGYAANETALVAVRAWFLKEEVTKMVKDVVHSLRGCFKKLEELYHAAGLDPCDDGAQLWAGKVVP